jgi:hypothetical protein
MVLANVAVSGQASAAGAFDGRWLVVAVTESGPCDASATYALRIEDGQVSFAGRGDYDVTGEVDASGAVSVVINTGSKSARATGRLSADVGDGRWRGSSASLSCSGSWQAIRG